MDKPFDSQLVSVHFQLQTLAEGVYAAIATADGAAFSNAGIVDLGNRTLVFDTFSTPLAARDLAAAAEQLTGRPADYVINSHAHADHWLGNQVFAGQAAIISTHQTRQWMPAIAQEIEDEKKDTSALRADIKSLLAQAQSETNERRRQWLQASAARSQYELEALPGLELCLPDQTFDGKLVFHGSKRTVELVATGPGHTPGDCYLALRDDCIALLGDLGFFGRQPYMRHSDPDLWIDHLDEIESSCMTVYLPGHGPVGSKAEIDLLRDYILMLEGLVRRAVHDGEPLDGLLQTPLPEPFAALSVTGLPNEGNIRFLYKRFQDEERA